MGSLAEMDSFLLDQWNGVISDIVDSYRRALTQSENLPQPTSPLLRNRRLTD